VTIKGVGAIEKETENPVENPNEDSIEKPTKDIEEKLLEEFTDDTQKELIEESTQEEPIEESPKNPTEEKKEESINKHKKIAIGIIIFICTALVIYFAMAKYFMNHFYFGTEINGINVSGKTVEDVKEVMASELQDYSLNIKDRDGKIEQIKGYEVGLQYSSDEEVRKLKDIQNPYKWILGYLNKEHSKITVGFLFDEKQLKERIEKLSYFDSSNIIELKNPSFQYVDNKYVIVNEVPGYNIDKDIVYIHASDAILNGQGEIDLESLSSFINPQYNSKSEKIIEVRDMLNKYVSSKITYILGENKETLDGSIINNWLTVDDNFEIIFDEEKAKDYIDVLFNKYNTIGKTREFYTSYGTTIKISGGDYGWSINEIEEIHNLISIIKEGKTTTKEPEYNQMAFSHNKNDIGNTYVEIDLEKQHIWFYKNGELIVDGDIVTGNISANNTTPKGIYRLKYKARNVVLRGPGYASPVTFWMPFNGGIGIHDASWRSEFGGEIYLTNGSRGCINSPYDVAKAIFDNIEKDTPVICY